MIRSFTLVESKTEDGKTEYNVSGDLPVEEVASALVRIALHTELPKQEPEKEVVIDPAGGTIR